MSDASSATRSGVVLAGGYSTRFGDRETALAAIDSLAVPTQSVVPASGLDSLGLRWLTAVVGQHL